MDTVTKGDLIEISALNSPPQLVKDTLEAAFLLLGYPAAEAKVNKKKKMKIIQAC